MTSLTLPADKVAARRVVRAARRARRKSADGREWAQFGADLAAGLTTWLSARPTPAVVAVYEALATEPPTDGIRAALTARNVQLLVPVLLDDNDLSWRDPASGADLGIDAISSADLVITPGLAVARTGGLRMGQGGGSYDRALRRLRPGTPVVTVLFDEELVDEVPAESHDLPVTAVLTPSHGVIQVGDPV